METVGAVVLLDMSSFIVRLVRWSEPRQNRSGRVRFLWREQAAGNPFENGPLRRAENVIAAVPIAGTIVP
jgi:hypothetical protein